MAPYPVSGVVPYGVPAALIAPGVIPPPGVPVIYGVRLVRRPPGVTGVPEKHDWEILYFPVSLLYDTFSVTRLIYVTNRGLIFE
jgi:hypothetical protein